MNKNHAGLLAFATSIVLLGGCATVTPIGSGATYDPDEREQRLWETTQAEARALINSGILYRDQSVQAYCQLILERILGEGLSSYEPLRPRVYVVDAPSTNAFALPHGEIFIHTGMLGRIRNEAQLAMLLGHEITHATHRHTDQRLDDAYVRMGGLGYVSVLSAAGGANVYNIISGVSLIITQAAMAGYGRDQEREADAIGLALMAQAEYDPSEGARMFQQMLDATDSKDRRRHSLYSSHPKMKDRVKSCKKAAKQMSQDVLDHAAATGQDSYVSICRQLIYGEAERHIAQGKYGLAKETLGFMKQARPRDSRPYTLLGDLFRARSEDGDLEMSVESYQEAALVDARDARAYRGLGICRARKGDNEQAIRDFRTYLQLAPSSPDADYFRGFINQLTGARK